VLVVLEQRHDTHDHEHRISKAKNAPASLVEILIPRTIMKIANTRKIKVQTIHGTFSSPPTL